LSTGKASASDDAVAGQSHIKTSAQSEMRSTWLVMAKFLGKQMRQQVGFSGQFSVVSNNAVFTDNRQLITNDFFQLPRSSKNNFSASHEFISSNRRNLKAE
jgi:hypothetical protein